MTRPFNLGEAPSDKTIMMPATTPNVGDALLVSDTPGGRVQLAFQPPPGAATIRRFIRNKTANYTIVFDDLANTIRYTGAAAATITLPSPAVVGDGWWCSIKHSGTGATAAAKVLTIARAVGLVDGLTSFAVYPGDTRTITCDGTNFYSTLIQGGYIEFSDTDSPFTLVLPTAAGDYRFDLWGGGGAGGAGCKGPEGTNRSGGGGGGGGNYYPLTVRASDVTAASVSVAVAPRVAGGNGITFDGTGGGLGANGGTTQVSFGGNTFNARGGRGGKGGSLTTGVDGGAGSGVLASGSSSGSGGAPAIALAPGQFGGADATGPNGATVGARSAAMGGASGGGSPGTSIGVSGGGAPWGGPGGGGGGSRLVANTNTAGGSGGSNGGEFGGGGAAGNGTGVGGQVGGNGALVTRTLQGLGGGGGAAGNTSGGNGGDGGVAAGGGGGGVAPNGAGTSGAGGQGGPGRVRFAYTP